MDHISMYSQITRETPELAGTYNSLVSAGPLDAKTRRLVKLGIAAGLASEGAVRHHAGRALHEGVLPDELRHAVALGLIMAGPGALRVLRWTEEVISSNERGSGLRVETFVRRRAPMNSALRTEFEAYSSILNNLKDLAQELKAKDSREFQVTETIRTHLLQMLDSSMAGPGEMLSGLA